LGPGVADADDRAAVEHVVRQAQALEPAAVVEALLALAAAPLAAAQGTVAGIAHVLGIPARKGVRRRLPGWFPGLPAWCRKDATGRRHVGKITMGGGLIRVLQCVRGVSQAVLKRPGPRDPGHGAAPESS